MPFRTLGEEDFNIRKNYEKKLNKDSTGDVIVENKINNN